MAALGYRAAYCPMQPDAPASLVREYESAARAADVVIAEVGAWSNPLSTDEATRADALEKCKRSLALADAIGARCCVNVAGSRGDNWYGPCADDLTEEGFDALVETVREIIDAVKPARSHYALETMPWLFPDSTQAYLSLIDAIDRPRFAVHFDPVNLISSPRRYFHSADLIREFAAELGPQIRSCHAKDIRLQERLTVHLDEVRPGSGGLDYRVFLREVAALPGDIPLTLEHLPTSEEYAAAAGYIRRVAQEEGIDL